MRSFVHIEAITDPMAGTMTIVEASSPKSLAGQDIDQIGDRGVAPLTPADAAPILASVMAVPFAVKEVSAVPEPTAPETVINPVPLSALPNVSACAPFTVLDNVIVPAPT